MVYVIKDTENTTVFAKIVVKQHKNTTCFSSCLQFFETNREVPAFFFQNCRKFLQFETPTPGQRKLRENSPPGQGDRANPRGSPGGGGIVRLGID